MDVLIVPAAGAGSRLSTSLPKLLVPVGGRPMIDHVLSKYSQVVGRAIVVVSPAAEAAASEHLARAPLPVDLALQSRPTGMIDALLAAKEHVSRRQPAWIWITWCDQVAISDQTVDAMLSACAESPAPALVLATARVSGPYTHLVRDADGRITGVLQRREGDAMPALGESDSGLFVISREAYLEWLPEFVESAASVGPLTRERNFLPFVPWVASRAVTRSVRVRDAIEALGVNTPEDLRMMEAHFATQRW